MPSRPLPFLELPYFNGLGGFTPDGREYAIYLKPGSTTPAPWSNVMASRDFGTMVTESGLGCTWRGNSQIEPADSVAQRSGQRSAIGSDLSARRRERRGLDADPASDPRKGCVPGAPRPRLHRLRAQQPRHRPGADGVRAGGGGRLGRSGEDLPAAAAQRFRTAAPADRRVFRRMGARLGPRRSAGARPDGFRSAFRRDSGDANTGTAATRAIRRLPRPARARPRIPATARCSWDATTRLPSPPRWSARAWTIAPARASIPRRLFSFPSRSNRDTRWK